MTLNTLSKKYFNTTLLMTTLLVSESIQAQNGIDDALSLSLTDLLSIEITSVSKKSQALSEVASAVFVITQDDIRRSGVTSIPEALRMAPGIQVAKIDSNKWAISSRGFAQQHANKLLVLIDGRSVYTPTFSGVYWEVQDTVIADIDRIEVIRGPGATVWGANAVNGVINIITKNASQTHDGLIDVKAGDEDKTIASFRYGTSFGDASDARFYLKYNERNSGWMTATTLPATNDGGDNWRGLRSGFRIDTQASISDKWTLQGDIYQIDSNQTLNILINPFDPVNITLAPFFVSNNLADQVESSGWNVLGKWEHQFSTYSSSSLQVYYDQTKRSEAFLKGQRHETFDIEFQSQHKVLEKHSLIWGLGYRQIRDNFKNTFNASVYPNRSNKGLISTFIQDEIEIFPETLYLTLGSKFEKNDDTGLEIQPNVRLAWLINEKITLWGAVSRAIRSPSRFENDSRIVVSILPLPPTYAPLVISTLGSDDFKSEVLVATELGYRVQASESFSADIAVFYNDYGNLRSFESAATLSNPFDTVFGNSFNAHSYGLEITLNWQPQEWLRLQSNYSYIDISGSSLVGSYDYNFDITKSVTEGSTPNHQFSFRSMIQVRNNVSFDLWLYYVSELAASSYQNPDLTVALNPLISYPTSVPSYTSINANLRWQTNKNVEISLVGQNLFERHHSEFVAEYWFQPTEIESSIYAKIEIKF